MTQQFGPLVEVEWLKAHLQDPELVIFDCRWRLTNPAFGQEAYVSGHIPGAVYVDLHNDLAAPPGPPGGRHPLPVAGVFGETMSRKGLNPTSRVVCYDDDGAGAARCWWLLTFFGLSEVAVLNGGFAHWTSAGGPVVMAIPDPIVGRFQPRPEPELTIDFETLYASREALTLVDARSPERYRGAVEPMDAVAGHIPGARNYPSQDMFQANGRFKAPDDLQALYAPVLDQTTRPVVYCGSGVTACVDILALRLLGAHPVLYPGSWSGWIEHPSAPIARG